MKDLLPKDDDDTHEHPPVQQRHVRHLRHLIDGQLESYKYNILNFTSTLISCRKPDVQPAISNRPIIRPDRIRPDIRSISSHTYLLPHTGEHSGQREQGRHSHSHSTWNQLGFFYRAKDLDNFFHESEIQPSF